MKHKKVLLIISLLLITFSTSIYAAVSRNENNPNYRLGKTIIAQLNSKQNRSSDDAIYAKGKDIVITQNDFDEHIERVVISVGMSEEEAKEHQYQFLVRRKVLLHAAKSAGYTVTDDELDDIIADKKNILKHPDIADDVQALYESFGGEDAYWEYIREIERETAISSKYINDKEKEYRSAHAGEDMISCTDGGVFYDSWEDEKDSIIQTLITEQDIQILGD